MFKPGLLLALCRALLPRVMPAQPSPPSSIPLLWWRNTQHFTNPCSHFFYKWILLWQSIANQILPSTSPSLRELTVFGQQFSSPSHSMDKQCHRCPCPGFFKKWVSLILAWTCNTGVLSLHSQTHLRHDTLDILACGIKRRRKCPHHVQPPIIPNRC